MNQPKSNLQISRNSLHQKSKIQSPNNGIRRQAIPILSPEPSFIQRVFIHQRVRVQRSPIKPFSTSQDQRERENFNRIPLKVQRQAHHLPSLRFRPERRVRVSTSLQRFLDPPCDPSVPMARLLHSEAASQKKNCKRHIGQLNRRVRGQTNASFSEFPEKISFNSPHLQLAAISIIHQKQAALRCLEQVNKAFSES